MGIALMGRRREPGGGASVWRLSGGSGEEAGIRGCAVGDSRSSLEPMKLISWNVNGLRAALRGGFAEFLAREAPDVLCLQEIKATPDDVVASVFDGMHVTWNPATKKGYSGVLIATRQSPLAVTQGMGLADHDTEGRLLLVEFPDFQIATVYTPNSQRGLTRLDYRRQWDTKFRDWLCAEDARKPVILCGDFNCAHEAIDLANPRENRRNAGFTDEERTGFSALLQSGFIDSFRARHPDEPGHYSWWTYRNDARARNIGWRLDYWLVSQRLWPRVGNAQILTTVTGSDHCPVLLELREAGSGAHRAEAPQSPAAKRRSKRRSKAPPPRSP